MKQPDDDWPPQPRSNTRLAGHADAEARLLEAWNSGRMPHAWLLTGRRGIGKATLAYRFAKFVLAQAAAESGAGGLFADNNGAPDSLETDPNLPVVRRVVSGGHSDLLTVERTISPTTKKPRGEIVVEDIRRLGSFLSLTTGEGSWRVVIVDAADELNRSAANAILKGLEEPPARTLFLLVSHMPGRLLPTIRSRCLTLGLTPLAEETVVGLIAAHAPDTPAEAAGALARLSDGSIGQALSLLASGGLDLHDEIIRLTGNLGALDVAAVHALGDKVGKTGAEDSFVLLGQLIERWLAAAIVHRARRDPTSLAAALPGAGGLARWLEVWEKVTRLFSQAGSINLNRKQVVVSAFLTLEAAARG